MNDAKLISTSDWRAEPRPDYRFFLYDPEDGGMMFFKTAETRDAIAAANIENYCGDRAGDGWSEEVALVCVGEVTARATKCDVKTRPQRSEFESEEEYEDAMGEWGGGEFDEICRYELRPVVRP